MTDDELEQRVAAVERLTALYRPERIVHIVATTVSLIVLLGAAGIMIAKDEAGPTELTLMFGSSGLITYTAGQLLKMWDRALSIIVQENTGNIK